MPDTFTANYNLTKPEPNASRDTWGTKWNANLDAIDGHLKTLATNKLQYNPTDKTSTAEVNFTGVPPKIAGKEIATKEFVTSSILAALPTGVIVTWSGAANAIPAGWGLCNGQNGTPDLQDRFIIGAGKTYAVGATGGATTHDHGGKTGGTAISVNQMPSHTHTVSDGTHTHGVNDPGHAHIQTRREDSGARHPTGGYGSVLVADGYGTAWTDTRQTGVYLSYAYSNISILANGGGAAHDHTVSSVNHLPPYYAFCFIMKLPPAA